MRRTSLLALAALGWLAVGCGDERPGGATPAPSGSPPASPASPSPTSPTSAALDGFPLALGYDGENGDDHSSVRVGDRPATTAFALCDVPTWNPRAGSTDVLGVEWRGEAEWARGRTLVLYPSVDDASAALTSAGDAVANCPDEPAELDYGTTHTLLDVDLGDQAVVWSDTYWFTSSGEQLHDTGLTVFLLVRVGPALLLAYEYGEGNGSEESRADSIERATELELPVVDRMRHLVG